MTTRVSRREFLFKWLVIAGLGAVGTAFAWIFGNVWTAASRFSSGSWVQISSMDRFAPGTLTPFPEHKIAVIRSSRKIGAISLECTHLGCLLNVVDQGFFCPCHGSEFGPAGPGLFRPGHRSASLARSNGARWQTMGAYRRKIDEAELVGGKGTSP